MARPRVEQGTRFHETVCKWNETTVRAKLNASESAAAACPRACAVCVASAALRCQPLAGGRGLAAVHCDISACHAPVIVGKRCAVRPPGAAAYLDYTYFLVLHGPWGCFRLGFRNFRDSTARNAAQRRGEGVSSY